MMDAEITEKDFYSTINMFKDLRNGIFSELEKAANVSIFRRNIQKSFIERMSVLIHNDEIKNFDLFSVIRGELIVLKKTINQCK